MRITFECPDEWQEPLEKEARKDGHENISAVCRKGISFFLFRESSFVKFDSGKRKNKKQEITNEKEN